MRECIYCGRQLEKGEVCTCAMSAAKRREREEAAQNTQADKTTDKAREREQKKQAKREAKRERQAQKRAKHNSYSGFGKAQSINAIANAWRLFKDFIKSPVETVMNPGDMGKAEIFILVIIEGIIGGLCAFSIVTGASRGPFSFLGNILGFKGISGYSVLLGWLLSALSGSVSGIIIFFIYSGVFYLVNRWIFKQFTPYWDFVKRFAFVAIPISVVGIIGIVLGMFSQQTFMLLLLCGAVGTVVLTYELLRSVWYSKSAAKTMYIMVLCIFIFLLIIVNITRFSM